MIVRPGQVLSHYRLFEKIGEGGMGVVWKAEDTVLRRTVAIKFLPADVVPDEARRKMFLQEARLASSLSDSHIAQVHDLGREGDLDFIVMEYVEGKPLSRILHGRPLPPDKVVSLGLQLAQALSRAHRKGLLHRDLKPGNILVTPDEEVKVVDFGLATLVGPPDPTQLSEMSTRVSGEGAEEDRGEGTKRRTLVGTLPYMSPEQAREERLDIRSDIFSLGVVLYEMATGQRPFTGATSAELLREIVKARPQPPHEVVPKLPVELNRIIRKALAPAKADRYQTTGDLAVDLKQLARELETGSSPSYEDLKGGVAPAHRRRLGVVAACVALLVVAAAIAVSSIDRWRGSGEGTKRVLILPMEVRGQTEGADYAGRAFAEAIAVNLVPLKQLKVLPVPAAVPKEQSEPLSPSKAAREVGAELLITGALTRERNTVHVSLSLVDTGDNRILWGAQKEAAGNSLPELAATLTREVSAELGASSPRMYDHFLSPTGNRAMVTSADMTEALGALRRTQEIDRALEATERLVEAFPNEPNAHELRTWALLQDCWRQGPTLPLSSPKVKVAEASLAELERLDPKSPWVDFFRAWSRNERTQGKEVIDLYTKLLTREDLTPAARAFILSFRGNVHVINGDTAGAVVDLEEALRLDPANDSIYAIHASDLNSAGRYAEALTYARQAVALNPADDYNQSILSWAFRGLGRWEEALAPAVKACELGRVQWACAWNAVVLQKTGHAREARERAREAAALKDTFAGSRALACYWTLVGNRSEALRRLRRAVHLGTIESAITGETCFESLRGDPEFEAIVTEARRLYSLPAP